MVDDNFTKADSNKYHSLTSCTEKNNANIVKSKTLCACPNCTIRGIEPDDK